MRGRQAARGRRPPAGTCVPAGIMLKPGPISVSGQIVSRRKASKLLLFLDLRTEAETVAEHAAPDATVVEVEVHANFTGHAEFIQLRQGASRLRLGDFVRCEGFLENRRGRFQDEPDRFNKEKQEAKRRQLVSQHEPEPELEVDGDGCRRQQLQTRSIVVADSITVLERSEHGSTVCHLDPRTFAPSGKSKVAVSVRRPPATAAAAAGPRHSKNQRAAVFAGW
eukprot:COSAG05_NODE_2335_length_3215_cov_17.188594_3_plen_223_part_00